MVISLKWVGYELLLYIFFILGFEHVRIRNVRNQDMSGSETWLNLKDVTTMSKLPLMPREKPQSPAGRRVFGVRASHGEAKNCRCRRWVGPSPSSCDAQFLWKRRLGPSMEEPWLDNQTTSNNGKPHLGAQHGHVFFHGVLRISFLKQFRRKAWTVAQLSEEKCESPQHGNLSHCP